MPNGRGERGSLLFSARVLGVLIVGFPSLWLQLVLSRSEDRAGRMVRLWARRAIRWSGFRLDVHGAGHLADDRVTLMVANHSSFVDSVVLLAALPCNVRFVANHLAATRPIVGLAIRKSGHLVVNRGSPRSRASCGRAMIAALRAGRSLMVFPEGTRGVRELLPFQIGPFRIAAAAACPITPVAIIGTRSVLPRRFRLLRRAAISVNVLPPIACASLPAEELRDRAALALSTRLAAEA